MAKYFINLYDFMRARKAGLAAMAKTPHLTGHA
jgi:hypothetical protein